MAKMTKRYNCLCPFDANDHWAKSDLATNLNATIVSYPVDGSSVCMRFCIGRRPFVIIVSKQINAKYKVTEKKNGIGMMTLVNDPKAKNKVRYNFTVVDPKNLGSVDCVAMTDLSEFPSAELVLKTMGTRR